MATVEKRTSKSGKVTYRITVAGGLDYTGKQIRTRRTWTPPKPDMTEKQIEKALARAVMDMEREIEQGYQLDFKQNFRTYADYVISLKERTGVRPRTIDRYRELLVRINAAIGHIKLADLRPQHLNSFYKNLGEAGIRQSGVMAQSTTELAALLKKERISYEEMSRRSGVSSTTIASAAQGKRIRYAKALQIADAIGKPVAQLFTKYENAEPLSDKTILEYHRLISSILAQAEKEMLIPYNPAAKATPPRVHKREPDYYQPDTIDSILDALEDAPLKWRAITYLLIDSGCRRGEAAGLKWESLDMETGIVTFERALLYSPKRGVYEGSTKSGKSRTIKLAPETIAILRQYRRKQLELRLQNGDRWIETGYVFTQDNGDRINPDSVTDWLNKFSDSKGLPHIHPHAFRHTAASTMIASGVDLVTTAAELGHANATTTATIYAHQIAEAKAKADDARSSVFTHRKRA